MNLIAGFNPSRRALKPRLPTVPPLQPTGNRIRHHDPRSNQSGAQLDKWEIRAGDSIQNYITSRIDQAEVVLCVITDQYVRRVDAPDGEGGYVQFELEFANAKKLAGDKVRVIGIYRQGSQTPTYLRAHLYVDFRDDATYAEQLQQLVDDLRGKSKRPPLGVPELKDFDAFWVMNDLIDVLRNLALRGGREVSPYRSPDPKVRIRMSEEKAAEFREMRQARFRDRGNLGSRNQD